MEKSVLKKKKSYLVPLVRSGSHWRISSAWPQKNHPYYVNEGKSAETVARKGGIYAL